MVATDVSLAERLSAGEVLALPAVVTHARRGGLSHAFRTVADHVLLAPEAAKMPRLMSHNRVNLLAFHDRDHGGARGNGRGSSWAWEQFAAAGIARAPELTLGLLTQPRFLGYWFCPVSFWLLLDGNQLRAVIAEVNNTFGQRHSYLLAHPDFAAILPSDTLTARKVFHVSPFQDVAGRYLFRFSLTQDRIAIRITHEDGEAGVETAMSGPLIPLTTAAILRSTSRRPGGALRVIAQIYWHALRLKLKGAVYRRLPKPPAQETSR